MKITFNREGGQNDTESEQQNGYIGLLYAVAAESVAGRICAGAQSVSSTAGQPIRADAGGGGLFGVLHEKSVAIIATARFVGALAAV